MTPEQKAHKLTDDELKKLERKIAKIYNQAGKDLEKKLSDYMAQFEKADKSKIKQLEDGKITQKQYDNWRAHEMMLPDQWKIMRETLAQDYTNANKISAGIMDDGAKNIYALNHNYAAYALEHGTNMNLQFTLYDKATVERLLKSDKALLPQPKVDIPKDLRWNKQKIQSAVTQGILQGEPIDKIANRLQQVTDMNHNAAVRNARTAATGAENAGRQDTYDEAVSKGIKLKKEWLATLDSRTRDAHQQLDGQRVEEDKPFKSEFGDIMYPGDPSADPANVYNCRCTMIAIVGGVEDIAKSVGEYQPRMTYSEWEKSKNSEPVAGKIVKIPKFTPATTIQDAESFASQFVNGSFNQTGTQMSYKGIDVKTANTINETLNELYAKYPNLGKLESIETFGKQNKKLFSKNGEAPLATSSYGNLLINKTICNDIDKYIIEGNDAFDYVVSRINTLSGKQLELAKMYQNAGRALVGENLSDFVTHEIGHKISYQSGINNLLAEHAKDNWETYAQGLSGYANHSYGEYVAESFVEYTKNGATKDSVLNTIFGGLANG